MKKRITLFCLLAFFCFISNAFAQCTTAANGLFPSNAFTPTCGGNTETITNQSWAGEYSNVNVIANRQYRFSSSVSTDYITITNSTGTITYASGTQPVIWDSGSTTGVIRYYLHSNVNCGSEQVNRSRYVRCLDASNCVPPSNLAVSNVTSNSCKVTWTAASPVPSSNYDIYISTTNSAPNANSTPTLFSTTNLSTSISVNVAAGTTYYYWIRSNCGATTGVWISGGNFTTPPSLICNGAIYGLYPDATFTPSCTGSTEQIASDAYAGEYSNVNTVSNKQYTFTSSISTDFITITNAAGTAVLASGLTPLTWLSGTTSGVIRYHLNTNSSCGTQNTNRVKSIQCTTPVSCGLPSGLAVSNITSNSCRLFWNAPNPPANSYDIYLSTNSTAPIDTTNATQTSVANLVGALNGLSAATTYYYWVRSNCNGNKSAWVSGGSFTTIAALTCNGAFYGLYPDATFTPSCSGNAEQIVNNAWAGEYTNVSVQSNKQYTFTSSIATDFITITNTNGTVVLASGITPLVWNSNATSGVIRYHFSTNANCGVQNTSRIRSITCANASSCNPPTQLFYDGLTSTTNTIAWLAPNPAPSNGYVYCYSTINDPFSANAITGTTADTFAVLNNLSPNTTYYFWVKSNCGNTQSNWVSGGSFTTYSGSGCDAPTQFWSQNITSTSATINWIPSTSAPNGGYLYLYGTNPNQGEIDGSTLSTSANLTDLLPNTTYYWWVASNCGNSQSAWVLGGSFTTLSEGCWRMVTTGMSHSLGIKTDGTLWAWGANDFGQLGDGTTVPKTTPIQIGTANDWQSVSAGTLHTMAIKTNGTLWGWGINGNSRLGDGTTIGRINPTQIGTATNWQTVCAGDTNTLAIKTNGTLWAWGYNGNGQFGDGTTTNRSTPYQIGTATNWQSVDVGSVHTLAIKTNGTLWAWGTNSYGQVGDGTTATRTFATQIGTDTDWQSVAAGGFHSVGLKENGILFTWGNNVSGQLGDDTNTSKSVPAAVFDGVQTIDAGSDYTVGTLFIGNMWSCGINTFGQLGNGTTTSSNTILVTNSTNHQRVVSGFQHTISLNTDGSISACGLNVSGQLGNGSTTNSATLVSIVCPTSTLGIDDGIVVDNNDIKVYPNPVKDVLTISYEQEITRVSVYNLLGQEVITQSINANETSIDVSQLPVGAYLVKVNAGDTVKTVKVIKQ